MSSTQLKVLLLSQGYEPIQIIPWETAVSMVFLGKVEVLAEYQVKVHSQYLTWEVPAVVRLLARPPKFNFRVRFSRDHLFKRDNFTCLYCGKSFRPRELTYDHVLPRSRGGGRSWRNIATACEPCNQKKGNQTPDEARMPLLRKPTKPRWYPFLLAGVKGPKEWDPFLSWLRKETTR